MGRGGFLVLRIFRNEGNLGEKFLRTAYSIARPCFYKAVKSFV